MFYSIDGCWFGNMQARIFFVKFDDELWAQVQPLCSAQCYDRRILIFICIGKILFVG